MEVSVIFIPCVMVFRSRKLQKETLQEILDWERNQGSGTSVDTGSTYVHKFDDYRLPSPASPTRPIRSELYSMKALEKALTTNITPLLRFSALKDFSAENISFLKHVQDWKANWTTASTNPSQSRFHLTRKSNNLPPLLDLDSLRRQQFAFAVEIYVTFVSRQYSDFPINISCAQYKELESIFSHSASTLDVCTHENTATPFDSFPCPDAPYPDDVEKRSDGGGAMVSPFRYRDKDTFSVASTAVNHTPTTSAKPHNLTCPSVSNTSETTCLTTLPTSSSLLELKPRLTHDVAIPRSFGPHAFDEAERAVKYVVLTNTWPKFVAAGFASKDRERVKQEGAGNRIYGGQRDGRGWSRLWGGAGRLGKYART